MMSAYICIQLHTYVAFCAHHYLQFFMIKVERQLMVYYQWVFTHYSISQIQKQNKVKESQMCRYPIENILKYLKYLI